MPPKPRTKTPKTHRETFLLPSVQRMIDGIMQHKTLCITCFDSSDAIKQIREMIHLRPHIEHLYISKGSPGIDYSTPDFADANTIKRVLLIELQGELNILKKLGVVQHSLNVKGELSINVLRAPQACEIISVYDTADATFMLYPVDINLPVEIGAQSAVKDIKMPPITSTPGLSSLVQKNALPKKNTTAAKTLQDTIDTLCEEGYAEGALYTLAGFLQKVRAYAPTIDLAGSDKFEEEPPLL